MKKYIYHNITSDNNYGKLSKYKKGGLVTISFTLEIHEG